MHVCIGGIPAVLREVKKTFTRVFGFVLDFDLSSPVWVCVFYTHLIHTCTDMLIVDIKQKKKKKNC